MRWITVCVLAALCAVLPAQGSGNLALLEVSGTGVEAARSELLYQYLADAIRASYAYDVLDRSLVRQAQAQAAGRGGFLDNRRVADLGASIGAKVVIVPSLSLQGGVYLLSLRIVRVGAGQSVGASVREARDFADVAGIARDALTFLLGDGRGAVLKLAILAPLSGPAGAFGAPTRSGALLAIEEWNARGGVRLALRPGGLKAALKIEPIVEDSQCAPGAAGNAAARVMDRDGVRYIIGEVCSGASVSVSEVANAGRALQISPASTGPQVTVDASGRVRPFTFRACLDDPSQGSLGAAFALGTLGARTAFVMLDRGDEYERSLAERFEARFTRGGGRIVGREGYAAAAGVSAIIARAAAARPDVVYLPGGPDIVNTAMRQARERGLAAAFVGADAWGSADLDTRAAEGGYFTTHYSPDEESPAVADFKARFRARFRDSGGAAQVPDALAALAYDAANLVLQALSDAGIDDPELAARALAAARRDGATGAYAGFDAQHNPVKSAVVLQVRGGRVVPVARVSPTD